MRTGKATALAAAAALAAFGGLAGCGEKCNTEPVAQVQRATSCTAAPDSTVTVGVILCPTCNQTGATCDVDVSQANEGVIQLDPTVEACDDVTTCGTSAPSCQASPLPCRFTAPSAPDDYAINVFDASTNTFRRVATLTVQVGAAPSCALAAASGG